MTQEFDAEMMKGFKELGASILARLKAAELDAAKWRLMLANTEPEKAAQLDAAITLLLSIQGEPK